MAIPNPVTWLTSIFSSAGKDIIGSITAMVDEVHTSGEEKLLLKQNIRQVVIEGLHKAEQEGNRHKEVEEKELTKRLELDNKSDSWLAKNIRPIALIFLDVSVVILAMGTIFNSELTTAQIAALKVWIPLFTTLLITAHAFYFGGRSYEKSKKVDADIWGKDKADKIDISEWDMSKVVR